MLKALIFDMDGVLIDSEPLHKQIEQDIMIELGVHLPLEEHFKFAAMGKEMWDILEKRFGFNRKTNADELHREKAKRYLKELTSSPILPIDGLNELIRAAQVKGLHLAVASSSSIENINLVVKAIGLKSDFSLLVSGEQVPRNKPFPDIYLKTAALLGVDPTECIVVEDSGNGVNSAKSAGMFCAGFHNPHSGNQDLSLADAIVEHLTDVVALLG